ncbi:hypothetical protein PMAYCL1PPCAC_25967, partial [Pristionchus mayeri]
GFEVNSCPSGFYLAHAGQCRNYAQGITNLRSRDAINKTIEECSKWKTLPVIIRNEEEQSYYTTDFRYAIPIGIICNFSSSRWQWIDESAVNYKPSNYTSVMDEPCSNRDAGSWYLDQRSWQFVNNPSLQENFNITCLTDINKPKVTSECSDFDHFEDGSDCYQVSNVPVNFTVAHKYCKSVGASLASVHNEQDNGFLRRLAFSKGILNGLLLGGSSTVKLDAFKWIDGSQWNYTNFVPGFPVRGMGTCLSMATNGISGQWTNTECSTKMPFACSRKPNAEGATKTCPGANVREDEIIVSPGFPLNASIPCDFFLSVPVGGLVEVEILLLEANSCCDHLVLTEGSMGGTVIANLTGAMSAAIYRTTASNMMRVSWQPRGGVNVRGVVMTFRGV